jgi:hypothetical protein
MVTWMLLLSVTAAEPIDAGEIQVKGTRPAPSVIFVDGGTATLRKRMRDLAAEAKQDPLARPAAPKVKSRVRVLSRDATGAWDGLTLRRAATRVKDQASLCAGKTRVKLELRFRAGRLRGARILGGDVQVARCVAGAARGGRYPSGAATATLELGLVTVSGTGR